MMQDIDAAYIFDDNSDLDASLSALLEVPSLDMAQFDNVNARPAGNATGGNSSGSQLTVGKAPACCNFSSLYSKLLYLARLKTVRQERRATSAKHCTFGLLAAGNYGAPPPRARGNLDGLVPDMKQQNLKRQRIDN